MRIFLCNATKNDNISGICFKLSSTGAKATDEDGHELRNAEAGWWVHRVSFTIPSCYMLKFFYNKKFKILSQATKPI